MVRLQNKWIIGLSLAMIMGIVGSTAVLHGMKRSWEMFFGGSESKEFLQEFKELIPDLQKKIQRLAMADALMFLSLHDGRQPIELTGASDVRSVAINGNRVVTGSSKGTGTIWDIHGNPIAALVGHTDQINSVAINGDRIVTGSKDETVKIWDRNGNQIASLEVYAPIGSVAINGDRIMAGSSGFAIMWDRNGNFMQRLVGLGMNDVEVAIDGNRVVTGSHDDPVKLWSVDGNLIKILGKYQGEITSVAINGDRVVAGSYRYKGPTMIWDRDGNLINTLEKYGGLITSVAINGNWMVTGAADTIVGLWDRNGNFIKDLVDKPLGAFSNKRRGILSVAIDSDRVVAASDISTRIWSLSINLQGTSQDNPLVWIIQNATALQADFINRAHTATITGQGLPMALPEKFEQIREQIQDTDSQELVNAKIYFSFPAHVRAYLKERLKLVPCAQEPEEFEGSGGCTIQ